LRIAQRSIEEVREAANIVEVPSEFTALRRQGARFAGLCPYPDHQEKTPSFSVAPDRGFYYCFGCQRGGDAIKLIMDLKSFDFAEAVSYLAERSGVDLQFEGGGANPEATKERADRRRRIHKALPPPRFTTTSTYYAPKAPRQKKRATTSKTAGWSVLL
jgi:DNA primase